MKIKSSHPYRNSPTTEVKISAIQINIENKTIFSKLTINKPYRDNHKKPGDLTYK
ncbi:hypothetical protein VS_II1185 [Vibrio atlanticus]|uniref:Uncharacterized protein n=1 Tax=Vibrio atlanticus (strain LGP32) TaxID=575788 RepID=B7VSG5_VIBA3|nr:hypothetical protein VS_II1185 [Vibrio atlanticus]